MKRILAILLAGLLMVIACSAIVYAEEEEEEEAEEAEEAEENETGEEEPSEEEASSVPGFEIAFALAALGAARLMKG